MSVHRRGFVTPFVKGRRFVCECGCNVFFVMDGEPSVYYCSCPNRYETTPLPVVDVAAREVGKEGR